MILRVDNLQDRQEAIKLIEGLPFDKTHILSLKVRREVRSIDQNKLYWLWLTCLQDETGNDKEDLHEFFKGKFVGFRMSVIFRQNVSRPSSTRFLDTKQFTTYLEEIKRFAAIELGIVLPEPKDQNWEQFYEKYKEAV